MTAFELARAAFNAGDLQSAKNHILEAYVEHSIPDQSLWIMGVILGLSDIESGEQRVGASKLLESERWLDEQEAKEARTGQMPNAGEQGSRRGFRRLMAKMFK